jgi:hypothetical protein
MIAFGVDCVPRRAVVRVAAISHLFILRGGA